MNEAMTRSGHFKEVCEFGMVHRQCRCPDRNKPQVLVTCDRISEHAPQFPDDPNDPLGIRVSISSASPQSLAPYFSEVNLAISYELPDALHRAIIALVNCSHPHSFAAGQGRLFCGTLEYYCLKEQNLVPS